jgi:hypothetical protein
VVLSASSRAAQAGVDDPPLGANPASTAAPAADPLLPDLRTLPPEDLYITPASGGHRLLHLANIVWNSGLGPLNLIGALSPSTQQTLVIQQLSFPDSDEIEQHLVGLFVYHPQHAHFHIEDFAVYELWSLTTNGELLRPVAHGEKLSYCLIETDIVDNRHPAFTRTRAHTECGQEVQGILPGWGDRYKADLPGQTIDITALPNGAYALLSTANPDRTLLESDYLNNTGTTYLELHNYSVRVVPAPERPLIICRDLGHC